MKRPPSTWFRTVRQLFSPARVRRPSSRLAVEQLADRVVPAGPVVQTAFFGGTATDTFDNVTISFDQDVDLTTFDKTDVAITGPGGAIAVTDITPTGADVFKISFTVQNTVGDYKVNIGPDVRNAGGEQMDSNRNGTPGEAGIVPAGDVFETVQPLAAGGNAAGPVVDVGTAFMGTNPGTFDHLHIVFRPTVNGIDNASFDATDVTITDPNGQTIAVSKVVPGGGLFGPEFDVFFAEQSLAGDYKAVVGPNILDTAGNGMDQNANGTTLEPGEAPAGDAYSITQPLTAGPAAGATFAIGAADGSVRVVDAETASTVLSDFRPLDTPASKYTGLISVASGDFNGDQVGDILIAAANPSGVAGLDAAKAGKVFVYDGKFTAGQQPALLREFTPFATSSGTGAYINGLNIAVGDVNGDGKDDLIAGTRGGTATTGKVESGRVVVIDGASAAGAGTVIGGILSPFSTGYQKGCVVAAGDTDGDGKAEVAVTRGGPVASTNDAVQTIKLKAFKFDGTALNELNLSGTGTPLAPFGTIGAVGSRIVRDGRVTFSDADGDGKDELIFTALDRVTDPNNIKVRVAAYKIDAATGAANLASTGPTGTTPTSYLFNDQVVDHAIAVHVRGTNPVNELTVAIQAKDAGNSGLYFINPLTGVPRTGSGILLPIITGGVSLDAI